MLGGTAPRVLQLLSVLQLACLHVVGLLAPIHPYAVHSPTST